MVQNENEDKAATSPEQHIQKRNSREDDRKVQQIKFYNIVDSSKKMQKDKE